MIEMDQVILDRVLGDQNISNQLGIERDLDLKRVLDRSDGADGMDRSADTAEPLRINPGLPRISALEDYFYSTPHLSRRPGLGNPVLVDLEVNAQMALNPRHRVERNGAR